MHEVCGSPSTLISIIFHFLICPFISYLLHFLPHFFHFLEGRSEPVHSAKKGMDSLDETYSLTYQAPNVAPQGNSRFSSASHELGTTKLESSFCEQRAFLIRVEQQSHAIHSEIRRDARIAGQSQSQELPCGISPSRPAQRQVHGHGMFCKSPHATGDACTIRPEIHSNDFGCFLELISRFEFEFRRPGNYFLNDSNFWCVHVNVPWPVCAHAFPFRMLWLSRFMMTNIYISMKSLWKVV